MLKKHSSRRFFILPRFLRAHIPDLWRPTPRMDKDKERIRTVECGICLEDVYITDGLEALSATSVPPDLGDTLFGPRLACGHPYCDRCLGRYGATQLMSGSLPIRCPHTRCSLPIPDPILDRVLDPDAKRRWIQRIMEDDMVDKFYCPNPRCSIPLDAADIDDHDRRNPTMCPFCHEIICVQCRSLYHAGFPCDDLTGQPHPRGGDVAALILANKEGWRRCSRCRTVVEKTTGCNHITCRCTHEFCYLCGETWDKHRQRCPRRECPVYGGVRQGDDRIDLVHPTPPGDDLAPLHLRLEALRGIPDYVRGLMPRFIIGYAQVPDADPLRAHITGPWLRRIYGVSKPRSTNAMKWRRRFIFEEHCGYCNRQFPSLDALADHLRTTRQHPIILCCGELFPNHMSLVGHTSKHPFILPRNDVIY